MASNPSALLHIVVVGFHHKKGCQVEFSYPPLVPGSSEESGEVPLQWKYLPTLALPDGAHNYSKDTVYFHLKNKDGPSKATVYGVSCYRQIDTKDIVNKTKDITRGTVQKSVCVLTTSPCFGAIAAKLELVTHAWFEQKDFTQLELLKDAYDSLSASLSSLTVESQATMGLHLNEVVKLYRHRILVLFKLIMLERKTVFFMTPVSDLCNVILSLLSLFPGLLELGLVESVQNTKTPIVSPAITGLEKNIKADDSALAAHGDGSIRHSTDNAQRSSAPNRPSLSSHHSTEAASPTVTPAASLVTSSHLSHSNESEQMPPSVQLVKGNNSDEKVTWTKVSPSDLAHPSIPALDSKDFLLQIDLEDQESFLWDKKEHTLALADDDHLNVSADGSNASRKALTINLSELRTMEVVPVVSPTSISIDKAGLPLAIFTKGSVCHPYLSLSYYDILEDVNVRSFVIGASNVLFKQKKHNIDVLVERSAANKKGDSSGIVIVDKELQKQLQLTTEDLRFANMIVTKVDETVASGEFLETTEWEGGDEWIRAQFKDYLQSLMATVLAEDQLVRAGNPFSCEPDSNVSSICTDSHLLEAFNPSFVSGWKSTHNYKVWRNTVQQLENVIPGHPCQGGVTLNDMKLQLARSERGRKINAAVDQAGKAMTDTTKAVGGALSNAKTLMSSWWSNIGISSPTAAAPPTDTSDTTE